MASIVRGKHPEELPFFHTFKSYQEVHEVMKLYIKEDGYFLLRRSFSTPEIFTLTITHLKKMKHLQILPIEGSNQYSMCEDFVGTMDKLIDHYMSHDVPNDDGISHIRLRYPISNIARRSKKGSNPLIQNFPSVTKKSPPDALPSPEMLRGRPAPPVPAPVSDYEPGTADYAYAASEDIGKIQSLLAAMRMNERCECGLLLEDAKLPQGWSVHRSREKESRGRLFFVSSENKAFWELPEYFYRQLSRDEKLRLERLKGGKPR